MKYVLLDAQNGGLLFINLLNNLEYGGDQQGANRREGSLNIMSPLPMATICCSPPLKVPAFWVR